MGSEHLFRVRAKVEVDLPPADTANAQQGIRKHLNSLLLR